MIEHKICKSGKHRFRMNRFGVTWCTLCGRLSNKPAKPLSQEEISKWYDFIQDKDFTILKIDGKENTIEKISNEYLNLFEH